MYIEIKNSDRHNVDISFFKDKEIIMFGAATYGLRALEEFENAGSKILCFCDNDKNKENTQLNGYYIQLPQIINKYPKAYVIVTSTYEKEILIQLSDMGIDQKRIFSAKVGVRWIHMPSSEFKNSRIDGETANKRIYAALLSDKPFFIGRLGSVELECICQYKYFLNRESNPQSPYPNNVMRGACVNAGFFPSNDKLLDDFVNLYLNDIKNMDFIWYMWESRFEDKLFSDLFSNKELAYYNESCIPIMYDIPWTKALENQKILVIHPFEKSIQNNFKYKAKLFERPDLLPDFELITLKAVQSIAGTKTEFDTWFDALSYMERQIDGIDFDIALIGAGGYGLPLGAYIKKIGKKALHIGGALQLYFGIKGRFYDKLNIYNEYWKLPYDDERPEGFMKVESGRYW